MNPKTFVDRFDVGLVDLSIAEQADPRTVLRILAQEKRFSVFEATDNPIIAETMSMICRSNWAAFDTARQVFPWTTVTITAEGQAFLDEQSDVEVRNLPLPLAADAAMLRAGQAVIDDAAEADEPISAADVYDAMVRAYVVDTIGWHETEAASEALRLAEAFAAERHDGQTYDGGSYLDNHLKPVMGLVRAAGGDQVAQVVALLHDTLEDTETTADEIVEQFGQEVADAVQWLTDDPTLTKAEQKAEQSVRIAQMPVAARLVKMADKTINTRGVLTTGWGRRTKLEYISGNRKVIDTVRGTNRYIERQFDHVYVNAMADLLQVGDRVTLAKSAMDTRWTDEALDEPRRFWNRPATITKIDPTLLPLVEIKWDEVEGLDTEPECWVEVLDLVWQWSVT